jgi:soluble lytic murein transglycosylase-like protein
MFNGDINLTIMGYNAGPTYIQKYNGENLPLETKEYHQNVIAFMNNFKEKIYWEK